MTDRRRSPDVEIAGIGFGPSNLALAIAIHEDGDTSARFFERKPEFAWHRGMLIDDATMQVSFLKDLATMRNPASDFSFVSYLHQEGRLVDFINYKTLYPLRIEFHAYLEWAAARVDHLVTYGHEVVDVVPIQDGGRIVAFDVVAQDARGEQTVTRARNVVVAAGLAPFVPDGVERGDHVWHTSELLPRIAQLKEAGATPRRFAVVGAGQSAAETVAHLHREFQDAEVCSIFGKFGYTPADDTSFANRIFDPEAAALFHAASAEVKDALIAHHRNTNYSVVDADLIQSLYREHYRERVLGTERLRVMRTSRVERVVAREAGVDVSVVSLPTDERSVVTCDAIVYATGYRPVDPIGLLGTAGDLCEVGADGLVEMLPDHRMALRADADAAIFLQGGTEHAFGLSSTLLSMVAIRAGQVFEATTARRSANAGVTIAA